MKYRHYKIGALTIVAMLCAPISHAQDAPPSPEDKAVSLQKAFIDVANKVGPAVVGVYNIQRARVQGYVRSPGRYLDMDEFLRKFFDIPIERRILGSGVIIGEDGYILTNEHVVGNADAIEVMLADGRKFEGKVVGTDKRSDLAVIKIDATGLPVVKLGDSNKVRTGQWAIAIGNPFGIFEDNPKPTMTVGVVSALHRKLRGMGMMGRYYGDLIQTDAAINPGNSGGPLLNIEGKVVGINAAIISPSGAYSGMGFAIPINRAKEIIEDLKEGKKIEYGWLGVAIQPVDENLAEELKLPDTSGVVVVSVVSGSPASNAGIEAGDVIREYGGHVIDDPENLIEEVGRTVAGKKVSVKLMRGGEEQDIEVVIGKKGEKVT
jgi:Do/DeqQ family serine protease